MRTLLKSIHSEVLALYKITSIVRIRHGKAFKENNLLFESGNTDFDAFSENCYRYFNSGYSKFHKMDNLCKLGFLGADILLNNNNLTSKYNPFDIGVILSNKNSSLDTDLKHHRQSQTGPASPAVFVYSLPNIVIGEICIRHGIKGENTFFVDKEFDITRQVQYIEILLTSGVAKCCIGGWVEFSDNEYDCFMYLVEDSTLTGYHKFTTEEIKKLYYYNE